MAYKTDLNDTERDLIKKDFEPVSINAEMDISIPKSPLLTLFYI